MYASSLHAFQMQFWSKRTGSSNQCFSKEFVPDAHCAKAVATLSPKVNESVSMPLVAVTYPIQSMFIRPDSLVSACKAPILAPSMWFSSMTIIYRIFLRRRNTGERCESRNSRTGSDIASKWRGLDSLLLSASKALVRGCITVVSRSWIL